MNVLVVDDSHFIQKSIRKIILSVNPDWQVDLANNGEEALELAGQKAYDVITLDYNMPGDDGATVLEKLRGQGVNAKFALITANKQGAIAEKAKEAGIEFIAKPNFKAGLIDFVSQ